jgi:uncharacterized protein YecE (DUF72 family)
MAGKVTIGPSGYAYPEWRGRYYPASLSPTRFLGYTARRFPSIELNGTFYSLKTPALYQRWMAEVPADGFVFAIKGSRYITHELGLVGCRDALANFYASGILALGEKTGPFLWQLSPRLAFDAGRVEAFLDLLPRSTVEAELLALAHDDHLTHGALTRAQAPCLYRHALEVRHESWVTPALVRLLERRNFALVIADTAGRFPYVENLTADFVYVRLHGSTKLYESRYSDAELERWATKVERWAAGPNGRDVYVYLDNTAHGHAPFDAERLTNRLARRGLGARAVEMMQEE